MQEDPAGVTVYTSFLSCLNCCQGSAGILEEGVPLIYNYAVNRNVGGSLRAPPPQKNTS